MKELTGNQIETLRIGLQIGFREPTTLEMFLREKLNRLWSSYVADGDRFDAACYKIVISSESEGWLDDLILEAHKARSTNPYIAKVGRELNVVTEPAADEHWSQAEQQAADEVQPLWRTYNPYSGMRALRQQEFQYLFGRDADVDSFINAIVADPKKILLALGASGVGKSSLILAGVLGALERRARKTVEPWPDALKSSHTWAHVVLTPGDEPVRKLASSFVSRWMDPATADYRREANKWRRMLIDGDRLDGLIDAARAAAQRMEKDPPQRYVLYVDQGEELYTRGGREPGRDGTTKETPQQKEARRFSELLAEAASHPSLIVLMSARSDFLDRLQADRRLSNEHLPKIFDLHRQININPLGSHGLEQVITQPAALLGVTYEHGLDKALATATREEIGGLPLLSDTLETIWQEMQQRGSGEPVLRWIGPRGQPIDIAKMLAERADAFVQRHKEQQPQLQRLFCIKLAYVPAQGVAARQRALISKLSREEKDLIEALAGPQQRIVVTGETEGQPTAEVAHERLFTAWETLKGWIDERRSFYAWVTNVRADREEWEKHDLDQQILLSGWSLERARKYLLDYADEIPELDSHFIRESIKDDLRRRQEQEAQELREERLKAELLQMNLQDTQHAALLERVLSVLVVIVLLGIVLYLGGYRLDDDYIRQVSTAKQDKELGLYCVSHNILISESIFIRNMLRAKGFRSCHSGRRPKSLAGMSVRRIARELRIHFCHYRNNGFAPAQVKNIASNTSQAIKLHNTRGCNVRER